MNMKDLSVVWTADSGVALVCGVCDMVVCEYPDPEGGITLDVVIDLPQLFDDATQHDCSTVNA